jgi:hypothetical protein
MALIKVVSYYHQCDACGKKIPSEGTEPQTGVVGRLDYPDSAHGQRQAFSFYSCKELHTHVAKAMRTVTLFREKDVEGRRNRGEAYSAHPDSS